MSTTPRILIVKLSAFGDVIQTLPLLHSLRSAFPAGHIGWAIQEKFASLIVDHPLLSKLHILDSKSVSACLRLSVELRAHKYDIVLDAQGLLVSSFVALLSGAPRRIGYNWKRECSHLFLTEAVVEARDRAHMVDKIQRLAVQIPIPCVPFTHDLFLANRGAETYQLDRNLIHIGLVIGASVPSKTLSVNHWIDVARRVISSGYTPVLIGGIQELPVSALIEEACSVVNMVGKTPLTTLGHLLSCCSVVVSSDTGALHLAVAVGAPTVALFGVSDPVRTASNWGDAPSVLLDSGSNAATRNFRHEATSIVVDSIPTDTIISAITKLVRAGSTRE